MEHNVVQAQKYMNKIISITLIALLFALGFTQGIRCFLSEPNSKLRIRRGGFRSYGKELYDLCRYIGHGPLA
jgi:hypothetical protein